MHPNGELIRRGFDAFAAGDMNTIDGLFADDISWHAPGTGVLSGDYHGKEQVFGLFGRLLELTEGSFQQEIHAILADDDHVVVLTTSRQDKPKPFTGNQVFVWHVRDGKVVECWAIQADQAGAAAAFD
jgi:uncharacterized protein